VAWLSTSRSIPPLEPADTPATFVTSASQNVHNPERRAMTARAVGTTCTIRYRIPADYAELPDIEPGDFLRTVPRGTCYRVDVARPVKSTRWPGARCYALTCTRLGRDAVQLGEPGVYSLVWDSR
jgi:hypothetical protein